MNMCEGGRGREEEQRRGHIKTSLRSSITDIQNTERKERDNHNRQSSEHENWVVAPQN
jgi:hypothetical protein